MTFLPLSLSPSRGEGGSKGSREPFDGSAPLWDIHDDDVQLAQRGDPAALDRVVRALVPYVGRICGAIAMNDGDDAMQETMVAVVRSLPSLREPAALRGWVRRIAVREAVRVAKGGRATPADPVVLAEVPDVADQATAVEVRAVLEALPPEQRAVLVLRDLDGLGEQEMADLLDVAPGTVKSRVHRARGAFREQWQS